MKQLYAELIICQQSGNWWIKDCTQDFIKMTGYSKEKIWTTFSHNFLAFFPENQSISLNRLLCESYQESYTLPGIFMLSNHQNNSLQVILQSEPLSGKGNYLRIGISDISLHSDHFIRLGKRLNLLEQCIPGILCQILDDKELTIIWYNQNLLHITGYSSEQLASELNFNADFIHPDDRSIVKAEFQRLLKDSEKITALEIRIIRNDKQVRTLMSAFIFTGEFRHNFPIFYAVGIDISAYKNAPGLKGSENRFLAVIESTFHCVWEYDILNHTILASESFQKQFGLEGDITNIPDSLIQKGIIPKESTDDIRYFFDLFSNGQEKAECTVHMCNAKRNLIWVKITMTVITDSNGQKKQALALAQDVTEQYLIEMNYLQEENLRAAMTYGQTFLAQFDLTQSRVMEADNQVCPFYHKDKPCSIKEFVRRTAISFVHTNDQTAYFNHFSAKNLMENFNRNVPDLEFEFRFSCDKNIYSWKQSNTHIIREPMHGHIYAYIYLKDINVQKINELELRRHAELDPLTELCNRTTLEQRCEAFLDNNEAHQLSAMLMIDLDDFKSINDNYGHAAGDKLIRQISDCLRTLFNENHILLGRLGGDEFIVFLPDCTSTDDIEKAAGRICTAFRELPHLPVPISSSIGIAVAPLNGTTFQTLYQCADAALYQAKRLGKNQFVFYNKSQTSVLEERNPVSRDWLLEESSDLVYVSDLHTNELLYMNQGAKTLFHVEGNSYMGQKCYEVLQGITHPCDFCTNHLLSRESFYTWELYNPLIEHYFILKDRIVDWYGCPARIEFATDVTAINALNRTLEEQLKMDRIIIDFLRIMNSDQSLDDAVTLLLKKIGEFYQAERAFMIQCNEITEDLELNYEWCQPNIHPIQLSQEEWNYYIQSLSKYSDNHKSQYRDNVKEIKNTDIKLYQIFSHNQTNGQSVVPLFLEGKSAGFIVLDNPHVFHTELSVLETLGHLISEEISRRRLSERLIFLSYHDKLTGLPNRNRYVEYLKQIEDTPPTSLGIAVADLNSLSEINRYQGHAGGDAVVKRTGALLSASFPTAQIFRLDGDEFLMFSENTPYQEFFDCVQAVYDGSTQLDAYGIVIGYAWSDKDINTNQLTAQANQMLMLRKQNYYQSIKTKSITAIWQHNRVQKLLDEIHSGFYRVYLQPQVYCSDSKLSGAEALARYDNPERGFLMPSNFIPQLERDYTIKYLDLFIFEETCRILNRWQQEGRSLIPIAVNFSRLTLLEPKLLCTLKSIAENYRVPAGMLELEITESVGDYEDKTIAKISQDVKNAGFMLALDDFGSHYTNMSVLSLVPADVLKFDRGLIMNLRGSEIMQHMLSHFFMLCKEMGIRSIAEGIETEEQLNLVCALGCNQIQGYLFGKPMKVEEFEEKFMNLSDSKN